MNDIHVARAMARERIRRLKERSGAARKPVSRWPAARAESSQAPAR